MISALSSKLGRWSIAPLAGLLLTITACGSSGQSDETPSATPEVNQTQVASYLATKEAVDKEIADSVAATVAAQAQTTAPEATASPSVSASEVDQSTPEPEPTATPPAPTATPEPTSAPTATPVPPAPTVTPQPPTPTPEPTEAPATPTPEPPATLKFERPDRGFSEPSGQNGSFAQASASFDVAQFPARAFVRSGVYFGLSEHVTSNGVIENRFVAEETSQLRITTDAGWNGVLRTNGWGSMAGSFRVVVALIDVDTQITVAQVSSSTVSIDSSLANKPVSGNQTFVMDALVEKGKPYAIQLMAVCTASGSTNVFASDAECIFDNQEGDGGYIEWRSLEAEYIQ